MKNSRIYPIRTSATQAWNIKLYSSHQCNESCRLAYVSEDYPGTSVLFIVDNPDYDHTENKCSKYDTYHPSSIHLSRFKREQPTTVDGDLLFYDQIVIPESSIYLDLSFPFSHSKKIQINAESSLGFSLGELVETIRQVYQWAYEKEEQTASEQHFSIQTLCQLCSSYSAGDQTRYYSISNSEGNENNDRIIKPSQNAIIYITRNVFRHGWRKTRITTGITTGITTITTIIIMIKIKNARCVVPISFNVMSVTAEGGRLKITLVKSSPNLYAVLRNAIKRMEYLVSIITTTKISFWSIWCITVLQKRCT